MGKERSVAAHVRYARHIWLVWTAALLSVLPQLKTHGEEMPEEILIEEGNCGPDARYRGYDTDGDGTADKLVVSGSGLVWDWSIQKHLWRGDAGELDARTVVIEEGITQIGACENPQVQPQGAFWGLTNLTSVTIPDGVTVIGERTFMYCTSLTEITIPDSVERIKFQAFEDCRSLAHVKLPGGLGAIDDGTFRCCDSLKSIEIPGSVTSIGNNAFDASGLTQVTLPGSVISIGRAAFFDCLDLKDITIWNSTAAIGTGEFDPGFGGRRADPYHGTYLDKLFDHVNGVTIRGYAGSTAQRYVEETTDNPDWLAFEALKSNWEGGYWYEDGVRQGVRYLEDGTRDPSYRGKEIFDPETNAWYWLDNDQDGAVARSKDVYQESAAGEWAECADGTGKWVRYDAEGHMVKGWDENWAGQFYFDLQYGTMAKGYATIGNMEYYFNMQTGVLESSRRVPKYGFAEVDGRTVFFRDYKRRGYSAHNKEWRGEEVTFGGPHFWLDNMNDGELAVSKDIWQPVTGEGIEVHPDPAEGQWNRYDSQGMRMSGWVAGTGEDAVKLGYTLWNGTYVEYVDPFEMAGGKDLYFFDTQTGAMAKGDVVLCTPQGEAVYHFDEVTGILDMP